MALTKILGAHHKLLMVLIYGIISEMLKEIVEVVLVGLLEQLCGKSSKPIIIHEDTQRLNTCDQNIYPEIKFETINKQWIGNVALDNHRMCFL